MAIKLIKIIRSLFMMSLFKITYGSKIKFKSIKILLSKGMILNIGKNGKIILERKVVFRNYNVLNSNNGIIKIGENTFFNNFCSLNSRKAIEIGENCLFGENVKIYDHDHKFRDNNKLISKQGFKLSEIKIGNNVWVGSNVVILKGSTIGDDSIIGAGSTINGNIIKGSIVLPRKNFILEKRKKNYFEKDQEI